MKQAIDARAQARAKENEALEKQYERVGAVNDLLEKYPKFAEAFSSNFGITSVTGQEENLQDMLDYASHMNAFMLGGGKFDNSYLKELDAEYTQLTSEQEKLQAQADSYNEEVEKGKKEYEDWSKAADELYGELSSGAEGAAEDVESVNAALNRLPAKKTVQIDILTNRLLPFAKGNWNVPYDMPAMVHRGETILTSSEARRYRSGEGSGDVDLSGLRSEIVGAIREGMQDAQVNSYLDGRRVSEEVNRYNNSDLASRRFAP